jgi:hypothetical protein
MSGLRESGHGWAIYVAAPPAGTQAPGWYRYKVGSFEITVVIVLQ